ncbi:MAG TPA: proline dehydrogenase family protein [Pseudonocardia sp.]|jgi:proline dehydrogenase
MTMLKVPPVTSPVDQDLLAAATSALKRLAADPHCREGFLASPVLAELFGAPAGRYVVAEDRRGLADRVELLRGKGYRIGIEYVGEEVRDPGEIEAICAEYLALVAEAAPGAEPVQLGFDLSNVGLLVSRELAVANTARIADAARAKGISLVISMERSSFVDEILDVYDVLAPAHPNLGLTVQAHLHRTVEDVARVIAHGRKVRLVKGVYAEPAEIALARSDVLNERYADLAERLLAAGVELACGTHDARLLRLLDARGITGRITELEMLHGVRPRLLRTYREEGVPCRVATVYGQNWWLHFLHRLAEYPPNVLTALADLADPGRVRFGTQY